MKDPAFLFYSKEFYEGTRMMLPEERACYVDLMIYQHQNGGFIPDNIKRLMMYCSGVDEATLKATLEAKFKRCSKGWYNQKLSDVISERKAYSEKQSHNGIIGQFWKHAKKELKKKEFDQVKKWSYEELGKDKLILLIQKNNQDYSKTLQGLLKRCLSIYANADSISNTDIDSDEKDKGGVGEKAKSQLILPFQDKAFANAWNRYKEFRISLDKFRFANADSEQTALKQLDNLSNGNSSTAQKIIEQSIAKGWKGLFELKTGSNKSTNHKSHANAKSQHRIEPAKDGFGSF